MPSATALRLQIERSLERSFPAALTPVPRGISEGAATGIPQVDDLLDGGLPVGAISEVTGPESSGRTSLALAFLAARTQEGRVCAWVDAGDTLDAESAAASGVALKRLLWVRCQRPRVASGSKPWAGLDQALRATDLLLQAGGFAALVLDLGSTSPEHACSIPLATWFRFRQAAHRSRASLLVLAQNPLAQSSAATVLECSMGALDTEVATVMSGIQYRVRSQNRRFAPALSVPRRPPASIWLATSAWQREMSA